MSLDQILADATAALIDAGGHPTSFLGDKGKTNDLIQALIVYTGLAEISQNLPDTVAIGDSLTTVIELLGDIADAVGNNQPVDFVPLIAQLELLRNAVLKV